MRLPVLPQVIITYVYRQYCEPQVHILKYHKIHGCVLRRKLAYKMLQSRILTSFRWSPIKYAVGFLNNIDVPACTGVLGVDEMLVFREWPGVDFALTGEASLLVSTQAVLLLDNFRRNRGLNCFNNPALVLEDTSDARGIVQILNNYLPIFMGQEDRLRSYLTLLNLQLFLKRLLRCWIVSFVITLPPELLYQTLSLIKALFTPDHHRTKPGRFRFVIYSKRTQEAAR